MNKAELRTQLQNKLAQIPDDLCAEKSTKACKNLVSLPEFKNANVIMSYLTLPKEADTKEMILCCWQQNKTVVVPKVFWQQKYMIPVEIISLNKGFSTEVAGLRNPIKGNPVLLDDIDIIITPALAFDQKGNRLGRGGGYYDRFFANKKLNALKCGFAFSEQIVQSIPIQDQDISVDILVTDNGIMDFRNRQGD